MLKQQLNSIINNFGLKMNLNKTKVVFNSYTKKRVIKINDNIIEEVAKYVYLGQEMRK